MMSQKNIRLRTAWYALIFLASILPAIALAPWLSHEAHELLLENSMLKEELYHKELSINLSLETKRLTSAIINKSDPIAEHLIDGDIQAITTQMNIMAKREPMLNTITIYDHNAQIITGLRHDIHTPQAITQTSPAFVIPFSGRIFLGSPSKLEDNHFEFTISVPITFENKTIAVLASTININAFWRKIKDALPKHDSKVYLIDGRGSLLTSISESQHMQGALLSDKEIVRTLLSGKDWHNKTSYIGFEGLSVFGIGSLVDNLQWGVISEISEAPILASIIPSIITLSLIVLFLHIFFGLISLFFTNYLINPISELAAIMKQTTHGDYTHNADTSQYHEINALSSSFNKMIHEISNRETSLSKMRYAMDNAGEAIIITSVDGTIEYVNATFCENSGYSQEEVIGTKPGSLVNNGMLPETFYQKLWSTLKSGEKWSGELLDRKKNGNQYPVAMNISPIFTHGEITHFIAIQKDISEKRMLEEQLRQSQKMESVGTLAGGIAHDFNNMLAGITGSLYLAKNKIKQGIELDYAEKKLSNAEELCRQAAIMVSHLLTFARKGIVDRKELLINEFVTKSLELAQHSVPENVNVTQSITHEPMTIHGDATQFQQILLNLINNANHAVKNVDLPYIQLSLDRYIPNAQFFQENPNAKYQPYARITVSDNGCGIAQEDLKHIFDPFFTTKAVGEGTGLGLSMVYGAVKSLSGYIQTDSTLDIGTTFTLYFPILHDELSSSEISSQLAPHNAEENSHITILLADDDEQVRTTTAEVLVSLGYKVLQAIDGVEASKVFEANKEKISIVILDVVMPNLGGRDLATQIRKIKSNMPVILVTGYDRYSVLSDEPLYNSEILNKPVDFLTLENTITKLLGL